MTVPTTQPPPLTLSGAVQGERPDSDDRPTVLLFFNVGCAGCVGRALPFAQQLAECYPALHVVAIHSQFRPGPPPLAELDAIIQHWGLTYTILLDDGDTSYRAFAAEGTPHWVILLADGTLWRSFFGSMAGSRQRLAYALAELLGGGDDLE